LNVTGTGFWRFYISRRAGEDLTIAQSPPNLFTGVYNRRVGFLAHQFFYYILSSTIKMLPSQMHLAEFKI
jgi:hypothetical protein